jgi:pimeloyl-ACP methyl ester carboxylesterase
MAGFSPVSSSVTSADGTVIGYTATGAGPAVILVDGALGSREFGPMPRLATMLGEHFTVYTYDRRGRGESAEVAPYSPDLEVEDLAAVIAAAGGSADVYGLSSGAALALEAARHLPGIARLALYEPPFIVDDSRPPQPEGFAAELAAMVEGGHRGDAAKAFLRYTGMPAAVVSFVALTPAWPKIKAVVHTVPHDLEMLREHQQGKPLDPAEWAGLTIPVLVAAGGRSSRFMHNATRAVADALPSAEYVMLAGELHEVKPQAIAPILIGFFT